MKHCTIKSDSKKLYYLNMPKCSNKMLITIQIHAHALGLSYSVCKDDDALGPVDGPWRAVYSANRSRAGLDCRPKIPSAQGGNRPWRRASRQRRPATRHTPHPPSGGCVKLLASLFIPLSYPVF